MTPLVSSFDLSFRQLDADSRKLLDLLSDGDLYQKPASPAPSGNTSSCGEYLVRSAAVVEQTFGGITTRLWDDPFEWTLPEKLGSTADVLEYLDDVERTRIRGFTLIQNDNDLLRHLPAPEKMMSLAALLIETLARARHFQGRAFAAFQLISDKKLPRL